MYTNLRLTWPSYLASCIALTNTHWYLPCCKGTLETIACVYGLRTCRPVVKWANTAAVLVAVAFALIAEEIAHVFTCSAAVYNERSPDATAAQIASVEILPPPTVRVSLYRLSLQPYIYTVSYVYETTVGLHCVSKTSHL